MARHNPVEVLAGAAVLVVAGGFLVFALASTGRSLASGGTVLKASFDHVDGLSPGAEIRIAGVKVGRIDSITLDPKTYQADVTFSVQSDVQLTADSSAIVSTDGLLGGKYIALASGGDEKILKSGDSVTITQGSVNLEALIGKYIFGGVGGKSAAKPDASAAPK